MKELNVLTCSVYPLTDLHVLLLVFDSRHGHGQLINHLLQFVLVRCEGTASDQSVLITTGACMTKQRANHIHMDGVKCLCLSEIHTVLISASLSCSFFWKAILCMSKKTQREQNTLLEVEIALFNSFQFAAL